MFYTFRQNNSGGSFDIDESRGIGEWVIIEAQSYDEAIIIAESIGIYFDGVECGLDCECCGDRWSRWCDENDEPLIYGQEISELKKEWFYVNSAIYIHYNNGDIVRV